MTEQIDFLQPDNEQIRHQIRGILDSYSHDWDVLAELCQNAVDSIARRNPTKGHIAISVSAIDRTIVIEDNGIGIEPTQLIKLLRPFASDKAGSANQIGQKGVGLTFVIFTSLMFEIESRHSAGCRTATIKNAASWLLADDDDRLLMDISEVTDPVENTGVRIKICLADAEHPLLGLSFDQLAFILRTRTAVGNTGHIWGAPLSCDVHLEHKNAGGEEHSDEFECNYLLPTDDLSPQGQISLSEWEDWIRDGDRSDSEKRKKLKDKVIVVTGSDQKANRTIRYWACLVPDRRAWITLSKNHRKFTADEEAAEKEGIRLEENPYLFQGGLFVSTKGMPTGIKVDLPPRGSAGYMPNFFIIIEDPSLNFDIGRKYIPGRLQGVLKEKAYDQFREYINSVIKYISGSVDDENARWVRDEIFDEIRELPELNSTATRFSKRPNSQEATVAAMFFEQLGGGALPDLRPMISGYKKKYDLYAKWKKRNVVLEFKYDIFGLLKDFTDERKMFDEVDVVVVWEVTERDRVELSRRGLQIELIEENVLSGSNDNFPLATHRLLLPNVSPIFVITMKKWVCPNE
ncbi:MAG TPA: ATP-binding protein [Caulobacter sp.]|nr:ATP-binding protein [Caulobacter sp.]